MRIYSPFNMLHSPPYDLVIIQTAFSKHDSSIYYLKKRDQPHPVLTMEYIFLHLLYSISNCRHKWSEKQLYFANVLFVKLTWYDKKGKKTQSLDVYMLALGQGTSFHIICSSLSEISQRKSHYSTWIHRSRVRYCSRTLCWRVQLFPFNLPCFCWWEMWTDWHKKIPLGVVPRMISVWINLASSWLESWMTSIGSWLWM